MSYETLTDESHLTAIDRPCPPDAPTDAEQAPEHERYKDWIERRTANERRILTIAELIATVSAWDAREIARFRLCIRSNSNPPKTRPLPGITSFRMEQSRSELLRLLGVVRQLKNTHVVGWLAAAKNATAQPALMAPSNRDWRADVDSLAGGVR